MKAHSKFFHAVARYLLFSVTMGVLGLTWGCGDAGAPQSGDDAAKAKAQEIQAKVKEVHGKKRLP
jgi:hypothetical protein